MSEAGRYGAVNATSSTVISALVVIENDAPILGEFLAEMSETLGGTFAFYEIVVIDNGSTDGSAQQIIDCLETQPNIHFVRLSSHTSTEVAITAALEHCIGDFAVLLDPYLDPPSEAVRLLHIAMTGHDVVIAERQQARGPTPLRRLAYHMVSRILGEELRPEASYFRVFSRPVIAALTRIKSRRRSLKYFNALVGYRQHVITTTTGGRAALRATDGLVRSLWRAADLLISNSFAPLRFAIGVGFLASAGSAAYLGYALLVIMLKKHVAEGWFTTSVLMSSMFLCLFFILGVLGEYVIRILEESQVRPLYFVEVERTSTRGIRTQDDLVNVISA